MKLIELRYLVALAREGNFSRAAHACSVSQPTLSMAVARLEDELGVHLFERGKGFVSPTAVGERIAAQAQKHSMRHNRSSIWPTKAATH